METKRICFVGLYDEFNMGDPVIAHCTEWLFTNDLSHVQIERLTLDKPDKTLKHSLFYKVKNKVRKLIGKEYTNEQFAEQVYAYAFRYFRERIKDCDLVILVGGGLIKYKYQMLGVETAALCNACEQEGKRLIINAVGIESYDENDKICQLISDALQKSAVKYISTRDDFTLLKESYLAGDKYSKCEKVADPAVWASESYGITRNQSSQLIGVGIGRAGLFRANDVDVSGDEMKELYELIVKELMKRGYNVQLFTNGLLSDNRMAERVIDSLHRNGLQVTMRIPHNDRELVEILSSYKAVIATRLHSCIISYALDIPAIGLVWNKKLSFFGENIGKPDNFVLPEHFKASTIVTQMEKAIVSGYDQNRKKEFKTTILDSVYRLKQQYIQS